MNINDLPDDCLLSIIKYIDHLSDCFTIGAVCSKWRNLIPFRFDQIKKLYIDARPHVNSRSDHLKTKVKKFLYNLNVSEIFPNLESLIMKECNCRIIHNFLTTSNSLIELDVLSRSEIPNNCDIDLREIAKHCNNIEYLKIVHKRLLHFYFEEFNFGHKLKRLYCHNFISMKYFNCYSPKLIHLKQIKIKGQLNITYNGPILDELEYLYYFIQTSNQMELSFLSYLPNLKFLSLVIPARDIDMRGTRKCQNVRKLFLSIDGYLPFGNIKDILSLFPSCENLRIYGCDHIQSHHLIELIEMNPYLSSIVFGHRLSSRDLDLNLSNAVVEYNARTNRKVSFFRKKIR